LTDFSPFTSSIIDEIHKFSPIVHEESNIALLFFGFCTKEYRRELRLHSVVQNLSGAGKSTIVNGVLEPFKKACPEDVVEVSRFTGPALQRYPNFDGKILSHSQSFGDEPQTILPLLSEGDLSIMVTEKEESSNRFTTKVLTAQGMPSFVSTSVGQLNAQLARRVMLPTVDESAQQTREILKAQARAFSELQPRALQEYPLIRRIISKLKSPAPLASLSSTLEAVVIPFGPLLEQKLPDNLEMRSNFPKFLKLIASVALVKSCAYRGFYEVTTDPERPRKKHKSTIAIAITEDFNDAYRMAGKGFFQPLSAAQSMILDYLGKQMEVNQIDRLESYRKVRMRELQKETKLSRSYLVEITKFLSDSGLILAEQLEESGHKVMEYQFVKPALEIGDLDPGESSPESWLEGKSYRKIEVEEAFGNE
jgi:hypothetical protein